LSPIPNWLSCFSRSSRMISRTVWTANSDGTLTPELMPVNPEYIALWDFKSGDNTPRSVCEAQSCTVGIRGGNGFLGTSGHRQMMNPSIMNLQHRLVLELSVGLSFDQRQAKWRIDLFWQQLQTLSARSCRALARNLHFSGYTQPTCS